MIKGKIEITNELHAVNIF